MLLRGEPHEDDIEDRSPHGERLLDQGQPVRYPKHCDGVFAALSKRPDVKPDLIVGHSGFGSTLFLRDLYPGVPIINLFEYFYRPGHPESDMGYRRDLGWAMPEIYLRRARCRNAMILLDVANCQAGYCPTQFQRSTFPDFCREKLEVLFDGVERDVYHGHGEALRPPPPPKRPRHWPSRGRCSGTSRSAS